MGSTWPWRGREAEASRARRALHRGRGATVLLVGGPAAGKTRLAREVTASVPTAWVAGCRAVSEVPLGAFARWVRPATRQSRTPATAVAAAVLGEATMLVVDDAHLLDDDSLAVVHRLVADPVCECLLTITSGPPWPPLLVELTHRTDAEVIELPDLSRDATADLLRARLGGPVDSGTVGRFFALAHGTPGYLVALGDHAVATGSVRQHFGVWSLSGDLTIPAHLPAVLTAQLTAAGPDAAAVVDFLTETDRLPCELLVRLTSAEALATAVVSGLVRSCGDQAELAHPMIAAIRRACPGIVARKRVREVLIHEVNRSDVSARDLGSELGLAGLAADDPGFPDRDFVLARGADAAVRALNLPLALRYCRAVGPGPFRIASLLTEGYVHALRNETDEADTSLRQARSACDEPAVAEVVTLLRVYNQVVAGDLDGADLLVSAPDTGLRPASRSAVTGFLFAVRGFAPQAHDLLNGLTDREELTELAGMYASMGLVIAAGDLGRGDDIGRAITRFDAQADRWRMAAHQRVALGCLEIHARYLIGDIAGARSAAHQLTSQVPVLVGPGQFWLAAIGAAGAFASAECRSATALLRSALAGLDDDNSPEFVWFLFVVDCAESAAMCGDLDLLREMTDRLAASDSATFEFDRPRAALLDAWQSAHRGLTTAACTIAAESAALARRRGQPAHEVLCWQTAVRFGDPSPAARLEYLARALPGAPRAAAAAAHARALAKRDGPGLVASAELYRSLGLLDCAADADAQAGLVFRRTGQPGAALSAQQRAQSPDCALHTPAIAAVCALDGLTHRQREILALADSGLTNQEIADTLHLSVRTVEGHRYRATHATHSAPANSGSRLLDPNPKHRGPIDTRQLRLR